MTLLCLRAHSLPLSAPTWNLFFSTMITISKDFSFLKGMSWVISSQPHFSFVSVLQTMQLDLLKRGLKWKATSALGFRLLPCCKSTWNLGKGKAEPHEPAKGSHDTPLPSSTAPREQPARLPFLLPQNRPPQPELSCKGPAHKTLPLLPALDARHGCVGTNLLINRRPVARETPGLGFCSSKLHLILPTPAAHLTTCRTPHRLLHTSPPAAHLTSCCTYTSSLSKHGSEPVFLAEGPDHEACP